MSEATWFLAKRCATPTIETVTVVRVTDYTVTIAGNGWNGRPMPPNRRTRESEHEAFFPTEQEARAWLLKREEDAIDSLRRQIEQRTAIIKRILAIEVSAARTSGGGS